MLFSDRPDMTSGVFKQQHAGWSDPWEKLEGVDPTGRGLDYWFRREIERV